jgi:transcriptional regulator with XRE-family HTH domain
VIDPVALRRLRHDRGLSQRRLAAAIGVDPLTVKRLEDGADPGDLPLRILQRIADTLGATPALLLSGGIGPPEPNDLTARIGGALLEHGRTTRAALATALATEPSQVTQCIRALDTTLGEVGMAVAGHADEVWLVPIRPSRVATSPERSLSIREARLLRRIQRGEDVRRSLSKCDRQFTVPALLRRGLASDEDALLQVAPEVSLSIRWQG